MILHRNYKEVGIWNHRARERSHRFEEPQRRCGWSPEQVQRNLAEGVRKPTEGSEESQM